MQELKLKKSVETLADIDKKTALSGFLFLLVIIVFVKLFLLGFYRIPTNSMSPAVQPGDMVIVCKSSYSFGFSPENKILKYFKIDLSSPSKGEIAAFQSPENKDEYLIKRITFVPGDSISFINPVSHKLVNLYLPKKNDTIDINLDIMPFFARLIQSNSAIPVYSANNNIVNSASYKILTDCYWANGDNSLESRDSRYWGVLPRNLLIGRAWIVYWSVSDAGRVKWKRVGKLLY